MTETICPLATWLPVSNHGGRMSANLGLVLHVQEGNNSPYGWFSNPASSASSTFWVSKSGAIEQYVDADLQAWAQSAGNATYSSVETEGYTTEPLTSSQITGVADVYRWGYDTYGWPFALSEQPGTPGLGWHGMGGAAWGSHPYCPGDLRKAQRQQIVDEAAGNRPTPPSTPPTPPPLPEEPDMIPAGCTFTMNTNQQQYFAVDANGNLVHWYVVPGRPWVRESVGSGWDPDSQLIAYENSGSVWQVWGVRADGHRAQCYWSGSRWVTQPLP